MIHLPAKEHRRLLAARRGLEQTLPWTLQMGTALPTPHLVLRHLASGIARESLSVVQATLSVVLPMTAIANEYTSSTPTVPVFPSDHSDLFLYTCVTVPPPASST